MATEVKVPALGESITEAEVLEWLVEPGDIVAVDQDLVTLETDKVTVNVPAPTAGRVLERLVEAGAEVAVGALLARIDESAAGEAPTERPAAPASAPEPAAPAQAQVASAESPGPAAPRKATPAPEPPRPAQAEGAPSGGEPTALPAAQRMITEHGLDAARIAGTGRGGRILKEDVQRHLDRQQAARPTTLRARDEPRATGERERVVPMSRLRRKIAENLVHAQQTAAMLTTFNEVDMTAVIALRKQYRDAFLERHGIKLGFTSFFAKAAVEALKAFPSVNAEVRGEDLVYKDFYNIGVAVGGGRGLVVPVIRDVDQLSFAEIEAGLAELAQKARDNALALTDLQGGTFTLSNGGVYGSLLSTPILNPPQVGILGLHKIEPRPVALDGQVVVRPMMYLALTYDHRIIDGREAVSFLVRIKELVEAPTRLLLEV